MLWNFGQFQQFFAGQAKICPVVKANAYGHDLAWVGKTLAKSQIWGFCVAYDTEAQALRQLVKDRPILVMSAWQSENLPQLIRHGVRLVVWDLDAARIVAQAARPTNRKAFVHVKIDTGTSRLGTAPNKLIPLRSFLSRSAEIEVEGVFSHLAESEADDLSFTKRQLQHFLEAAANFDVPLRHIACTAASLRLPLKGTNLVRLGIGLYGLWPSAATKKTISGLTLKPVLAWKTRVLQVKTVPASTAIGYERTFITKRRTKIVTLPIGYADGYDRQGSNKSKVVIDGVLCPVVGRVGMNLIMADATGVRNVHSGSLTTLIGEGITADQLAQSWGTIHYEVVSRINSHIPRLEVP